LPLVFASGFDRHHLSTSARRSLPSFWHRLSLGWRSTCERDQRYIAQSLGMPLKHFTENLEKLPKARFLLVYCAGGYRSSIAASLLESRGFSPVSEIAGGIVG
jgi:hydroxyacylglutathione hydrolase